MKESLNHIKKFTLREKRHCPEKEELAAFFLRETSREKKFKLIDHIIACSDCRAEFHILKELWQKGHSLFDPEIEQMLEKASADQVSSIAKKELKALAPKKGSRWVMGLSPLKAASLTAISMAAVLIIYLAILDRHQPVALERNLESDAFQVLEPWNPVYGQPVIFRWIPVSGAKKYAIEILDSGLEVAYRQEGIRTTSFELPDTIFTQLSKSKTYFWKVIATLDGGKSVESEFGKFQITGN